MKITEHKQDLLKNLEIVEKALPRKTTIQTLNNILYRANNEQTTYTANNLKIAIQTTGAGIDGEVELLLPSKIINIVKSLPNGEIEMEFEEDKLTLKSGSSKFNLSTIPADDYPETNIDTSGECITFDGSKFKEIIKRISFCASHDQSRPAFTCVLFRFDGDELTVTCSDTYRLAMEKVKLDDDYGEREYLIPADSLKDLQKIIGEEVKMYPKGNQVTFEAGGTYFCCRLFDDRYPDVKSVIPEKMETTAIVDRGQLEESLQRASLLVDHTQAACFNVGNQLSISVKSEYGSMEESIDAGVTGDEKELYLNASFMRDICKVLSSEKIELNFGVDASHPCIIRPEEEEDYLYLVLPIKKEGE